MYSKALYKIMIFGFACLVVLGCSEFLKGKKHEQEVIELSDEKFVCLKKLPEHLKKMSLGTATDSEINGSFACAQQSLLYFEKRTQGSHEDGYSSEDMRKFFGKYFLKENNITPEAAKEILKLKKALFGGSLDWVSKDELRQLVAFLGPMKEEVLLLSKHMNVLLVQKKPQDLLVSEADDAIEQLRSSLQKLMIGTELSKSDYSFEDAKKLLMGLSNFVAGAEAIAPYKKLAMWMPLVESVKQVLIGRNVQLGGVKDWSIALNNLVDLYAVFLRYHYVVQHENVNTKESLQRMSDFGFQVYQLISSCFQMSKVAEIPFADVDSLVDETVAVLKLPFNLSAKTIKETYRVAILKILEPYRNGDTRGLSALTRVHLLSLKRELNVWRLSQVFIDGLDFGIQGKITQKKMLSDYNKFDFEMVIRTTLEQDTFEQKALRRSWADFGVLLNSETPVVFNEFGRYEISNNQKFLRQTWKSLTKLNMVKSFSRIVLIGYGDENPLEIAKSAVSEAALVEAYDDFHLFGQGIKAFDPRNLNTGARSFKEANFFTFSGNGDARMEFKESFEFFSILISAGLGTSANIQSDMSKSLCALTQVDVFGYKMLKESCFKNELRKSFKKYFDNLPRVTTLVESLNDVEWDEFYAVLLRATRMSDPGTDSVEMADLRTLVVVLHYADGLMLTYDQDGSRTLSLDEIYSAVPRFNSFLRATYPEYSDVDLADGFAYMLIYGREPTLVQAGWFRYIGKHLSLPPVNHINVLKVIEVLKDKLN